MKNIKTYKDFIIPTKLDNFHTGDYERNVLNLPEAKEPDPALSTTDLIYIDELETKRLNSKYCTDFAAANGVKKDFNECATIHRSTINGYYSTMGYANNTIFYENSLKATYSALAPLTRLSLDACNYFKIETIKAYPHPKYGYGEIELKPFDQTIIHFAEYPNSFKKEFQGKTPEVLGAKKTGNIFSGRYDYKTNSYINWQEYEIDGEKYVYGQIKRGNNYISTYFDDTDMGKTGEFAWFKVEPIKWIITNWKNLPKNINPNGNGKDDFLQVETDFAIMGGLPYIAIEKFDNKKFLWQNSTIRGYLNSINVNVPQKGDNLEFAMPGGGNFEGKGFLAETLEKEIKITKQNDISYENEEENIEL